MNLLAILGMFNIVFMKCDSSATRERLQEDCEDNPAHKN